MRLLWDDDNLYFGFTAEETDVWATLTERDSKIWFDNDLEIFVGGRDAYYEFEINAHNTIYEVFWIWKDMYRPGEPVQRARVGPGGQEPHDHRRDRRARTPARERVTASSTGTSPACATPSTWTAR